MPAVHDNWVRMFAENICNNINKSNNHVNPRTPPPSLIIHTIGSAILAHFSGVCPVTLLQSQDLH